MSYESVPGFVSEREEHGEKTVVVEPARLLDAALHLRDELGFNFLADIAAADYLGWNERSVAGYWGSAGGRDGRRSPFPRGSVRHFPVRARIASSRGNTAPRRFGSSPGRGGTEFRCWCSAS